jgi:hypothetical protein
MTNPCGSAMWRGKNGPAIAGVVPTIAEAEITNVMNAECSKRMLSSQVFIRAIATLTAARGQPRSDRVRIQSAGSTGLGGCTHFLRVVAVDDCRTDVRIELANEERWTQAVALYVAPNRSCV